MDSHFEPGSYIYDGHHKLENYGQLVEHYRCISWEVLRIKWEFENSILGQKISIIYKCLIISYPYMYATVLLFLWLQWTIAYSWCCSSAVFIMSGLISTSLSNSNWTISSWPFWQDIYIGVWPLLSLQWKESGTIIYYTDYTLWYVTL